MNAYRGMTFLLAGVTALLGVVMLGLTIARGGGVGLVIGVLFLDDLIVIALSALFMPHYLAGALHAPVLARHPWDVLFGIGAIVTVGAVRLVRRPSLYGVGIIVPALDLLTQVLLVVLGFVFVF